MSKRIGNVAIICTEEPDTCELCGAFAELHPYGSNREKICIDCAIKDKPTTERMMKKVLFGEDIH